ncbi:hypothetical protein ACRALDRAFT_2057928 [Sodiomyces alcalophilus JCM 7366]|uniref:uncharacterized protein n=1 Tax=Sodiomyces alcalophilus JCM 7366 TaxID=591952 RepID=UPI0039B5A28F
MHIQPVDNATAYEPFVIAMPVEQTEQGHIVSPEGAGDIFDDVWGSEPSSPTTSLHRDHDAATAAASRENAHHLSDIRRLQTEHTTSGYREGITAGKAESLQAGFDEGFSLGAAFGSKAGQLLGLLEGIAQALVRHPDAAVSREAMETAKEARADLSTERLFTAEFFNTDGTWKFAKVKRMMVVMVAPSWMGMETGQERRTSCSRAWRTHTR